MSALAYKHAVLEAISPGPEEDEGSSVHPPVKAPTIKTECLPSEIPRQIFGPQDVIEQAVPNQNKKTRPRVKHKWGLQAGSP